MLSFQRKLYAFSQKNAHKKDTLAEYRAGHTYPLGKEANSTEGPRAGVEPYANDTEP